MPYVTGLFLAFLAFVPAQSHSYPLCSMTWTDFQDKLGKPENRLGFHNDGGPLGIGMCWWHSRMQRNANFLLDFRPWELRGDDSEIWSVIKALMTPNRVMAVRGFSNLRQFSTAHSTEMREALGQWQLVETFLGFNWVNGLQGGPTENPADLAERIDRLFIRVNVLHQVVYVMLNLPGTSSHSLLIVNMLPLAKGGYMLETVDSNFSDLKYYFYHTGDDHLSSIYGGFVPYVQRSSDLDNFQDAIQRTCSHWGDSTQLTPFSQVANTSLSLEWATDIAQSMNTAYKDSRKAETTFQEFLQCSMSKEKAGVRRAICAANAKRLALRNPNSFYPKYLKLYEAMPIEYREFLDKVGQ